MNAKGRRLPIDIEPQSGLLIDDDWTGVIEYVVSGSLTARNSIERISLFVRDSIHIADYELR